MRHAGWTDEEIEQGCPEGGGMGGMGSSGVPMEDLIAAMFAQQRASGGGGSGFPGGFPSGFPGRYGGRSY